MPEKRTLVDRFGNRLFAIPAVAQLWAKLEARRTGALAGLSGDIPFTPLKKPLRECRVALLTTGGIHLAEQPPFDMDDPDGDASPRAIPGDVDLSSIVITHKYYDHRDADRDVNVLFPLQHFRDLVEKRILDSLAARHFSFMGHIDGRHVQRLIVESAPAVASQLKADGVDVVFLTPA